MKNNFIKSFVALICLTLCFSILSPSLSQASGYQNLQTDNAIEETIFSNELDNDILTSPYSINQNLDLPLNPLNGSRLTLESEVQPFVAPIIPLLATLVIRKGVTYIVKTSAGRVVKIASHAADQAVDRKITGKMIDDALTKGTKYVDGWSRERIAWDQNGNKTAVLLKPNTDIIDTVYPEDHQKIKWIKSTWQYVGDID